MKYRKFMFALALLPVLAWAQEPVPLTPGSSRSAARDLDGTNATNGLCPAPCPEVLEGHGAGDRAARDRPPAVIAKDRAFNDREAIHNASSRSAARDLDGTNATTRAVLLANCPKGMAEADWLKLMEKPVNRTLYPLRLTQAMLDTLDAEKLDLKYRYVLVR
jgi:hypothetical protein